MKDKLLRKVRFSRSAIALWGVTAVGIILMFVLPSSEAENAVQVGTCGAFAAIVVRGLNRADAMINASLRLAEELARQRSGKSGPPNGGLARVVPLQATRSERSEAS